MTEVSQPTLTSGSTAAMIRTLTLVAVISGVLVVLVFDITRPTIAENQRLAIEKAIFQVIPNAATWQAHHLREGKLVPGKQTDDGVLVYIGFDRDGAVAGMASEAAAQGYADTIKLLYGYNTACECITGIKILKSVETPGLGDKIFKDPEFNANFHALSARLNDQRSGLENSIVTVKHGKKTQAWQIDAISGATISSRAVGKAINNSAQYLLPRVFTPLSELEPVELKGQ